MTSTRARRQRLQDLVGESGKVEARPGKHGTWIFAVVCTKHRSIAGRTYRSGKPNGFYDALYRWTLHLNHEHPGETAPCLERLAEARQYKRDLAHAEALELNEIFDILGPIPMVTGKPEPEKPSEPATHRCWVPTALDVDPMNVEVIDEAYGLLREAASGRPMLGQPRCLGRDDTTRDQLGFPPNVALVAYEADF